jgi:hypothetical protein
MDVPATGFNDLVVTILPPLKFVSDSNPRPAQKGYNSASGITEQINHKVISLLSHPGNEPKPSLALCVKNNNGMQRGVSDNNIRTHSFCKKMDLSAGKCGLKIFNNNCRKQNIADSAKFYDENLLYLPR